MKRSTKIVFQPSIFRCYVFQAGQPSLVASFLKLSHLCIFLLAKQNTSRYEVDFRRGCFKQMERSTFHLKQWVKWAPHKKDYFELKGRLYIIVSGHFFLGRPNYVSPLKTVFFGPTFHKVISKRNGLVETSTPDVSVSKPEAP